MVYNIRAIQTRFLIVTFLGGMALMPLSAFAADTHDPAYDRNEREHQAREIFHGPHVEGHIAFLHAELHITPDQEALFAPVAMAMREDVKNMEDAENKIASQGESQNAIQYLENRTMFARLRAEGESRFLAAFRPLYEHLSDAQKKMADELLTPYGQE